MPTPRLSTPRSSKECGATAPKVLAAPVGRCGRASLAGEGCPLCSGHLQVAATGRRLLELRSAEASLAMESPATGVEARPLLDQYIEGELAPGELHAAVLRLYGA